MNITRKSPELEMRIQSKDEFISELTQISKDGGGVYGFDPFDSKFFDDFANNLSDTLIKFTQDFTSDELERIEEYEQQLVNERNDSLIKGIISHADSKPEIVKRDSLGIADGYSFEDVPAKISKPSILEQARLDYENPDHKELPSVIKIGGVPFGSLGNFSMIIGKPKSKKSFLTTLIASSALNEQDESGHISVSLPEDKSQVVYFDTEQTDSHVFKVAERVKYMVQDFKRNRFETFVLRPFSIEERLTALEELFTRYPNIGLVIIDGIKDLVSEINNEKQSTEIAAKLLEWTHEFNIHIIVVLHQNKGDDNARGHLGGELQNKAETTVSIRNQKNTSIIKAVSTRNEEFQPFGLALKEIRVDNRKVVLPLVETNLKTDSNGRVSKQAILPENISIDVHKQILSDLSPICISEGVSKTKGKELIRELASKHQLEFGTSKAQEFLQYYEEKDWVYMAKKNGKGRSKLHVSEVAQ